MFRRKERKLERERAEMAERMRAAGLEQLAMTPTPVSTEPEPEPEPEPQPQPQPVAIAEGTPPHLKDVKERAMRSMQARVAFELNYTRRTLALADSSTASGPAPRRQGSVDHMIELEDTDFVAPLELGTVSPRHAAEWTECRDMGTLPASPTAVAGLVHAQTMLTGSKKLHEMRSDRMSRSDGLLEIGPSARRIQFAAEQNVRFMAVSEEELLAKRANAKETKQARRLNREAVRREEWLQRVDRVVKQEAERMANSSGSDSEPEPDHFLADRVQSVSPRCTEAAQVKFEQML
jgi:hypothetical protein